MKKASFQLLIKSKRGALIASVMIQSFCEINGYKLISQKLDKLTIIFELELNDSEDIGDFVSKLKTLISGDFGYFTLMPNESRKVVVNEKNNI